MLWPLSTFEFSVPVDSRGILTFLDSCNGFNMSIITSCRDSILILHLAPWTSHLKLFYAFCSPVAVKWCKNHLIGSPTEKSLCSCLLIQLERNPTDITQIFISHRCNSINTFFTIICFWNEICAALLSLASVLSTTTWPYSTKFLPFLSCNHFITLPCSFLLLYCEHTF